MGTWVAQSLECLTLAHVMISWFVGSSPMSGFELLVQSLVQILCLPLSLPLPQSRALSLSKKFNKH